MKSKLKSNLIIMEFVFLLIVVGGSVLVYSIFAAPYYARMKTALMKEAYEDCREADMTNLQQDDFRMLESYEDEHISFVIADEKFQPVYTTDGKDPEGVVRRTILICQDKFGDELQIINRDSRSSNGIRLRGTFIQDGVKYYIYLRETAGSTYSAFSYTERFLQIVVIIALLLGSIVMYLMSRRIARPIEKMAVVSRKLAEHDFSARVTEETPYKEVNELAQNFNNMADQIQFYIQKLEKNNSELECSNEKLQEQNDRSEKLEQMRREFCANISHELKTPLAVISSQVEMLQFTKDEDGRQYYFSSIREEIEKMSDMIRNLLKISSAEHELQELDCAVTDLSETTEYLLLKYDALFQQKEIKRDCHVEPGCRVLADRSCIERAISNYMLNAFSHTGAGGQIRIELVREGSDIVFRILNEGKQIPEQEIGKVWDHYFQEEQKENHAGLGLYIVRTIILLHKGKYGVRNQEKGVEFWFSLPEYKEAKEDC